MGSRRHARVVAACACIALGLVASALVRRAGGGPATADAGRDAFLEERRERMRIARDALIDPGARSA